MDFYNYITVREACKRSGTDSFSNLHYHHLCIANLLGHRILMDRRPVVAGKPVTTEDGSKGVATPDRHSRSRSSLGSTIFACLMNFHKVSKCYTWVTLWRSSPTKIRAGIGALLFWLSMARSRSVRLAMIFEWNRSRGTLGK